MRTERDVATITPISFDTDAREVSEGVNRKLVELLRTLTPEDWSARTECPAWDVADMVGHIIGAAKAAASKREVIRQQVWALRHKKEHDGNDLDAMNALHVQDHRHLSPAQRLAELERITPQAISARMSFPKPLRKISIPLATTGSAADGMPKKLSLGHLMSVIYSRDVWLHRVDIARATGRELDLNAEVDGRIVEDVVREWAESHGRPFRLTLTGPAGDVFSSGEGGQEIEVDAVEFCRIVSGRASGTGLLATKVLF